MKQDKQRLFGVLFLKLKWMLYSAKIKLFPARNKIATNKSRVFKKNIFLFFFLLFPIVQFLIFYIGVNFNSIMLAFRTFGDNGWEFAGLDNFKLVVDDIFVTGRLRTALLNSTTQFLLSFIIGIPLHVVVAYVLFRGIPGSKFFRYVLFMPNMISSLVFVICFRYLITNGLQEITGTSINLLSSATSDSFYTVLLFGFWLGFASGMIIYLGAMSSIDKEVLEYCELENMSSLRLLWSIVVPLIFPTIITYIVVGMAGFFTSYGHFHSFFGTVAQNAEQPFDTLGYVFFVAIARETATEADYSYAAAGGLLFTAVIAPLTITVKSLLEKYGPGVE